MPINALVSICIPTYKRPELLAECLASSVTQSYRPLEIIISDDSPDGESERTVTAFRSRSDIPIHYIRNQPALGQNANVNQLFDFAAGDRLVLIHDDDYLLPDSVSTLAACWDDADPLIAYGFQHFITHDGTRLGEAAARNAWANRTPQRTGRQLPVIEAALILQIPNNGYMVKTDACRRVRYCEASEFQYACDFEFNLRLGQTYQESGAFLVAQYTAARRESLESVSTRSSNVGHVQIDKSELFDVISALELPSGAEYARTSALTWLAPDAIKGYSMRGLTRKAIMAYLSDYYELKKRLRFRGSTMRWSSPLRAYSV